MERPVEHARTPPEPAPRQARSAQTDPAEMLHALRARRLAVMFQPQYSLPGLQLSGFEALVRLHVHDDHCIGPEGFLPLAHAAGLMGELTLHVVESACRLLRGWRAAGLRSPVSIAVNIEPGELADVLFGPRVCRLLAEYRIAPGEIEFELVERRLRGLGDTAHTNIALLRGAGVRFAMDDFGTGQSALSQLAELPFDIVKIDKSFLSRIPLDRPACTLMDGVVGLCHALDKEVVVEGVENDAQLAWLACQPWKWMRVQGNGLSLPLAESTANDRLVLGLHAPC